MFLLTDARHLPLADRSVQCVVTSPPYFGLRDYGVPGQIGLEPTPDAYVTALVAVFREVRRVLRDDGTVWLNLGDSYAATSGSSGASMKSTLATRPTASKTTAQRERGAWPRGMGDCKPKDLIGIPWRVAFALQADGWYLRQDIIWAKPNPMPESVRDRCTKAHEYVFLLTKSPRYFWDAAAMQEPGVSPAGTKGAKGSSTRAAVPGVNARPAEYKVYSGTRNRRSVWTVTTQPFPGAHFAVMPEKLVEPCVLAGSRPGDVVLDPFGGSGTTALVATRHGRRAVSCDLNPAYHALAKGRIDNLQPRLLAG